MESGKKLFRNAFSKLKFQSEGGENMIWITLIAQISLNQASVSYILEVEKMYQQGSLQKVIENTSQILNYEPHNIRAKKAIMRLMERGLDFYIDKPYNLSY